MGHDADLLRRTAELAIEYLDGVGDRPVGRPVDATALRQALGGALPEHGAPPGEVVERLVAGADGGIVASAGPRYFGFVIGGSLPASLAADWLASTWDQNASLYVAGPAAAVAEAVVGEWVLELLDLPRTASVGLTTGTTTGHVTALAAARHAVLREAGWDVEADGLFGAPPIAVFVGEEAHSTVDNAIRLLGLGASRSHRIAADDQGRMSPEALRRALDGSDGPAIVIVQAGNVDTGAVDPLDALVPIARSRGAWVHVDGAFGLWAAVAPSTRHLLRGVDAADSWVTDGHKWPNVPYDSGIAIVRDRRAHRAAVALGAAYLPEAQGLERNNHEWVLELSRRARAFPLWAAIASLGRSGLAELVESRCALARRMADALRTTPGVRILNDVVLNQVLVRFTAAGEDEAASDARTRAVIAAVQRDGTCWVGGTSRGGRVAMRISVSNWSTTAEDADRSVEAIVRCAGKVAAVPV